MVGLTIYTAFESMRYNRQEIAVLGMVGAYAIPFLISANNGRADLLFLMGIFCAIFTINALAYRLVRCDALTIGDIQQVVANNVALYLSSLVIFGYGQFGTHLAATTGYVAIWMILIACFSYLTFKPEGVFQQSLAVQAVVLMIMFIGFYWSGFFVTILWVVFAIVLFGWGILVHRSWPRLAAILLMIVTLGKLIIFDSSKFSAIQKIAAYLLIGALLLMLSFFYQKKRTTIQNRDFLELGKDD